MNEMNSYKLIILDCPYDMWFEKKPRKLLNNIYDFRMTHFRARYERGILPFDSSDYFATHIIIAKEKKNKELDYLMTYKIVRGDRIKDFKSSIPGLSFFPTVKCDHYDASIKFFEDSIPREFAYTGSASINSNVKDPETLLDVLHLHAFTLSQVFKEQEIKRGLVYGIEKYGVPRTFKRIGFKLLSNNNKVLPSFHSPTFFGESMKGLVWNGKFSDYVENDLAPKFMELWNQREVICANDKENSLVA
jgi:hypothetical protein